MSKLSAPAYQVKRTLGFLVLRSQRLISQQLERAFATVGLNLQQNVALQLIYEGVASGPSDIAKACGYDTGSTTRLVDQLADRGFLERTRDGTDRRQVSLRLTPEGRAAAEAAQAVSARYTQDLLADIGDGGGEAFIEHLTRLVARLEERADV
jgi:DNA-binding MarR family transcriptional regulator